MLVETKNLSKVYGDKVAVNDLNIQIERGSFTAILGPNGAGKSTTIQMLIGLLKPTSGQICYAEKLRLGVVFQNSVLDARLTVWENLKFFASLYDVRDKGYLLELLAKVDLTSHKNKLAKHLSGGLKRRLNFAIGLINRPKVIFLDEITVGIDPQSRQFILDSVAALKEQGVTVIYTSHYLQEIEQLCDKLVLLNEGNLIYQGTVQGILEEGQSLERFYLDFLNQAGKTC